ncbi:MAG: hypothetical protein QQN63_13555 [Nitrosopumilus sp.]
MEWYDYALVLAIAFTSYYVFRWVLSSTTLEKRIAYYTNKMKDRKGDGYLIHDKEGHGIQLDEPLTCPLSGDAFYRWQWDAFRKADPEWRKNFDNERYLNVGDNLVLVAPWVARDRQEEIRSLSSEAWDVQQADWNALTIKEKIVEYNSRPVDSGPSQRLSMEGNYEIWNDGGWKIIDGSVNELTGKKRLVGKWVTAELDNQGSE